MFIRVLGYEFPRRVLLGKWVNKMVACLLRGGLEVVMNSPRSGLLMLKAAELV
jgi:hypothetical protein